ncbi:PilN domain-containing protein [Lichenicola sp.]|uniref:PilN domain-containing protein n=1 Tax=Lichenicola sp. TaxID=2804529 RepID=UPI003B0017CA
MIADVLTWWSRQMLDLVPARFARPDPSAVGALLVEPHPGGDGVRLLRRQSGEETVLGNFALRRMTMPDATGVGVPGDVDPDDAAVLRAAIVSAGTREGGRFVLLRLPAGAALQRDVTLPLAAEAGLDRVLAYEMDRLTPFAADDIFFAWTVLRRDREAGRIMLRLSLVPKAPLLPLLDTLRLVGASPRGIEIPAFVNAGASTDPNHRLRIPLAHERTASAIQERRLLVAAGAACAALAVLAIMLPFALQSVAASRLNHQVAALQPRVDAVQALRRRIAGSTAGGDLVATERHRLGDTLEVLAAVTRVLPDDSYLSDLTLRQGQLTISGQSPGAAKLIPAISSDPAFSAPAFSAPVTRIEGQNTDLFSIRAGISR